MEIEELRYDEDDPGKFGLVECSPDITQSHKARMDMISDAVRISTALFPELGKVVETVHERLCPHHRPEFYVQGDAQIQACCITLDNDVDFAVILSSGIVNLMNAGEISFVLGHEIGHHLFRHNYCRPFGLSELAFRHWQRAAEVSADRAGLVCAPSENDGISAMIKIASGLGHPHFKFNALSYRKQAKQIIEHGHNATMVSSHPTLPLRAHALHLFTMSEPFYRWRQSDKQAPISKEKLDNKIRSDFERAEGGGIQAANNQIIRRALLWCLLDFYLSDEILTKAEQRALEICAGKNEAHKAVKFVQAHGKQAVRDKCKSALNEAKDLPIEDKKKFENNLRAALPGSNDNTNTAEITKFIARIKTALVT